MIGKTPNRFRPIIHRHPISLSCKAAQRDTLRRNMSTSSTKPPRKTLSLPKAGASKVANTSNTGTASGKKLAPASPSRHAAKARNQARNQSHNSARTDARDASSNTASNPAPSKPGGEAIGKGRRDSEDSTRKSWATGSRRNSDGAARFERSSEPQRGRAQQTERTPRTERTTGNSNSSSSSSAPRKNFDDARSNARSTSRTDRNSTSRVDAPRPARSGADTRPYAERTGNRRTAGDRPAFANKSVVSKPATAKRNAPSKSSTREDDEQPRLSKRMSELGLCSRREADEWIEQGWVRVNGEVVNTLGVRVTLQDKIEVDSRAQREQSQRVTVLLHKPIGYVSGQAEDGYEPASVLVRPENRWEDDLLPLRFARGQLRGLAPAGRLDIDSTGLLVLTQDGRIARQLIGDDSTVEKEYLVRVEGSLSDADLKRLNHGLSLDGKALKPAKVNWQNEDQLRFVLREGKKRQIRRMCELVGLRVVGLKRIRMGGVTLGKLPPGKWRYLRPDESF